MRWLRCLLLSPLIFSVSGCGGVKDAVPRVVVKGTVTKDGSPLADGRITLYPAKGVKGPASGAEIKDGAYKIAAKGGVPVGTHRVEIHEYEVKPNLPGRPAELEIKNNILPDKFNATSKVELTVESGSKEVVQDYDLDNDFGE
jgi:hypothetical protein